MIWALGYLIGVFLCTLVLLLTVNCEDDETIWLVSLI